MGNYGVVTQGGGGDGDKNVVNVLNIAERDALTPDSEVIVRVEDASADPNVDAGVAWYQWNGTAYDTLAEGESVNIVPASETNLGLVEIATSAEVQAGADAARVITPNTLSNDAATVLEGSGLKTNNGKLDVDTDDTTIEKSQSQINPGADSSGESSITNHLSNKWGISNNAFMFVGSYDTGSGLLSSNFQFGGNTINVSQSAGNGSAPTGKKYVSTSIDTGFFQMSINGANSSRSFTLTGKQDIFGFHIWEVDATGIGGFAFFEFKSSTGPYDLRVWSDDPATDGIVGLKDGGVDEPKLDAALQTKINEAARFVPTVQTSPEDLETNFPGASNIGKWALVNNATPRKTDGLYLALNTGIWQRILDDSGHPIGDLSLIFNALTGIGSGSVDILGAVAGIQTFRTVGGANGNNIPNIFDGNDSSLSSMSHSGASATHGDMFVEKFFDTGSYALNKFKIRSQNSPWPQDTLSLFNIQGYDGATWINLNLISADGVGSLNSGTEVSFGNGTSEIISSNTTDYFGYRIRNFGYTNNDTQVQTFEGFESIDLSETINLTDSVNLLYAILKNFGEWQEDPANLTFSRYDYENQAIIKYQNKLYYNYSGATVPKGSTNPANDTANWTVILGDTWREDSGATVNILISDFGVRLSGTDTGAVTCNLPSIASMPADKKFRLVDIGRSAGSTGAATNNITLVPNGSDTIVNDPNFIMDADDMSLELVANKTYNNWELF